MSEPSSRSTNDLQVPENWDEMAANRLFDTVDTARDKITGPAISIARGVVYGCLLAILVIVAVVITLIGLVRLLDVILPWEVWLVYLVLGTIFTGAGLFLWSKRPEKAAG